MPCYSLDDVGQALLFEVIFLKIHTMQIACSVTLNGQVNTPKS